MRDHRQVASFDLKEINSNPTMHEDPLLILRSQQIYDVGNPFSDLVQDKDHYFASFYLLERLCCHQSHYEY